MASSKANYNSGGRSVTSPRGALPSIVPHFYGDLVEMIARPAPLPPAAKWIFNPRGIDTRGFRERFAPAVGRCSGWR